MKQMNLIQMEQITGGGEGRTCMILGGVAVISFIAGFGFPNLWGVTGAAIITGAVYGCFN